MEATQIAHPLLNVLRGHGQHLCIPYHILEHYHILLENVTDTPWWPHWPLGGRKPCRGPNQFHFPIRERQHQPRARLQVFPLKVILIWFHEFFLYYFTNFSFLEEDSDVNIKGKTTPTNEMLSSIPSPLRPLSLNIKSETGSGTASAGVVMKVDAQQQTPVESCHQAHNTHLQLRFADERYELKFSAKKCVCKKKFFFRIKMLTFF